MANIIKINKDCYEKIMGWTHAASGEISGLGLIDPETMTVYEVFLPKQKCTGSNTLIDEQDLVELVSSLDKGSHLKFWWHSHVNMGVFWSGTDNETAHALASSSQWMVSLVVNKKNEYKCRLDIYNPIKLEAEFEIEILDDSDQDKLEQYKRDVADKVENVIFSGTYNSPEFQDYNLDISNMDPLEAYKRYVRSLKRQGIETPETTSDIKED